ncbi:MAG: hypothetical protein HY962_10240 [Ignavibacteriae bacterium]|nr:hypothetical protein [Ignavibacteriota bacterium]
MMACVHVPTAFSQERYGVPMWTWMHGDLQSNKPGRFGTLGVPHKDNIPGSRHDCAMWADTTGNMWIFGGLIFDATPPGGNGNDLWRWDARTSEWTWMSGADSAGAPPRYGVMGTPSRENTPGARGGSAAWRDHTGRLWLFGGWGLDSLSDTGALNDLWMYSQAGGGNWTWMGGSSKKYVKGRYGPIGVASDTAFPGARTSAACATDSRGRFWMYGGYGMADTTVKGTLADLWMYDPSTQRWTWMAGTKTINTRASYGATDRHPGGRILTGIAVDETGDVWLYGGSERVTVEKMASCNDLWRFDITRGQWEWVHGSPEPDSPVHGGTQGWPAKENTPGARSAFSCWMDDGGRFWLFGGAIEKQGGATSRNDVWAFLPESRQWVWLKGSLTQGAAGYSGVKGVRDARNTPRSFSKFASTRDDEGIFWFMGGTSPGVYRDLWRLEPALPFLVSATTSSAGWTMLAPAVTPHDASPCGYFCVDLAVDPVHAVQYGTNAQYGTCDTLRPSQGVWLWNPHPQSRTIRAAGYRHDSAVVSLRQGWNCVGWPFEFGGPLSTHARIREGGEERALDDAKRKGWIKLPMKYFDPSVYATQPDSKCREYYVDAGDKGVPWRGYWLYACKDGLALIFRRVVE